MISLQQISEKINEFEQVIDKWFKKDLAGEYRSLEDRYKAWRARTEPDLELLKKQLEARMQELKQRDREVFESRERLERRYGRKSNAEVEEYNAMVGEHNRLVTRYQTEHDQCRKLQEEYNSRVLEHNRETEDWRQKLDAAFNEASKHQFWKKERGPENFFRDVNGLYAALVEMIPTAGTTLATTMAYHNHVCGLRKLLGEMAQKQEASRENGVLVLPATLNNKVEAFFVVDPAATIVTVTPELVRVLGLTGQLGEEIEVLLPAGQRAYGRSLTLPSLTVQAKTTENIAAVQLESSSCGVDGLLGLSYLNRFNYSLHREKPQKLRLRNSDEIYDFFISYNFDDEWWAQMVHDVLTVLGYNVFLSSVSLSEIGDTELMKSIHKALEVSRHMLVVTTSAENLQSRWVQHEIDCFLSLSLKGQKGKFATILCDGMKAEALGLPFSTYQAMDLHNPNFRTQVSKYFPLDG
jgi:hypothetical protein